MRELARALLHSTGIPCSGHPQGPRKSLNLGSGWLGSAGLRVHLQRRIQLGAAKVQETSSCIGAFRAREIIKELILDI